MPSCRFSRAAGYLRAFLANARKDSENAAPPLAKGAMPMPAVAPDQQDTLQMDLSPLAKTFFGPVESKNSSFVDLGEGQTSEDQELLRAKTRRLDSFAEDEGKLDSQNKKDVSEEAVSDTCGGGAGDIKPLDLTSVFDQEARLEPNNFVEANGCLLKKFP